MMFEQRKKRPMAISTGIETVTLAGAGVDIAADVGGPVDGTPVVLLHGGGQTRFSWGRAGAELAVAGYRTISLDLRGHGESGWSADGDYRLDRVVDDLAAVLSDLPAPAFLVGASLGGQIGRASCRERVCQAVEISVGAAS